MYERKSMARAARGHPGQWQGLVERLLAVQFQVGLLDVPEVDALHDRPQLRQGRAFRRQVGLLQRQAGQGLLQGPAGACATIDPLAA